MNTKDAMKLARRAVGKPCGSGTSWSVYGPYTSSLEGLSGPSTALHADSYWSARAKRAEWVAYLTLRLIGLSQEDADAAYYATGETSIEGIVEAVLKHHNRRTA